MSESFPRQFARTNRFSNGHPSGFTVSADGARIVFLRSGSSSSRTRSLWGFDVTSRREYLIADAEALLAGGDEDLAVEERARRERMRESGAGFTSYSPDARHTVAVAALSGRLVLINLDGSGARLLSSRTPAIDPRLSPDGRRVSYVSRGGVYVLDTLTGDDTPLVEPDGEHVFWGLPDFIAAEELSRFRGHWWSPDSAALLVERVDESPVPTWHIADPANPSRPPTTVRYPAAGQANALVSLWMAGLDGSLARVEWDQQFPYLATVSWPAGHPALLSVLSRDQRSRVLLRVTGPQGAAAGGTAADEVSRDADPNWLDVVSGLPAWDVDGTLLSAAAVGGALRMTRDGEPITPPDVNVRALHDVTSSGALVSVQPVSRPAERHLWWCDRSGARALTESEPGLHDGRAGGSTVLVVSRLPDASTPRAQVFVEGELVAAIAHHGEQPSVAPRPHLLSHTRTAVLMPAGHVAGSTRLPVLMSPYGGPHSQQVVAAATAYAECQWLADQGFAVVIVDGRGTPGTPDWERAVSGDLAHVVLEDQIAGLTAAAAAFPRDLDLGRVGIRGWSFGGYLAALAVLDRPDIFHAAVAGAPVTDWALYDTAYSERYLGRPQDEPDAYERCSLIRRAGALSRPLMLVHGMADDNVVVAHTLRLSQALLAAGRPHTVLPLTEVTHLAGQPQVAENLLLLQLDFLRRALG